jgi:hypothetical protein
MERELWRIIVAALKGIPPTRPRNAVYTDGQIVAVLLWAALHDRPVSWGCQRRNWPVQAWRRPLPDQSTMSRRLRRAATRDLLGALLMALQRTLGESNVLVVDGKPLELSDNTTDPDARTGRGAGRFGKGYKLHLILDARAQAVRAYQVHPLNAGETTTAARLLRWTRTRIRRGSLLLGDRLFDSNPLHAAAHRRGCQLVAPRQKPEKGVTHWGQHPGRLESIRLTEGSGRAFWEQVLAPQRTSIERFFGALTCAGAGMPTLPPWVRRLHRVRFWVGAKLVINAARIVYRKSFAA